MPTKKKRYRKNKKWIPYRLLTAEERQQLCRESNKKQFRKELLEAKLQRSAAVASGNDNTSYPTPHLSNEVGLLKRVHV